MFFGQIFLATLECTDYYAKLLQKTLIIIIIFYSTKLPIVYFYFYFYSTDSGGSIPSNPSIPAQSLTPEKNY